MGILLSTPITKAVQTKEQNERHAVFATAMQGYRDSMEDTYSHVLDPHSTYCGVFDGHYGDKVAKVCADSLHGLIQDSEAFKMKDYKQALTDSFLKLDERFIEQKVKDGATAIVTLIIDRHIYIANAGDCRAILSQEQEVIALSEDHKPTLAREKARIEAAGGFVKYAQQRVRLNGEFDLSRAFGDIKYKIPRDAPPERSVQKLRFIQSLERKIFSFSPAMVHSIVLSSLRFKGIWGAVTNEYVRDFMRKGLLDIAEQMLTEKFQRKSKRLNVSTCKDAKENETKVECESDVPIESQLEDLIAKLCKDLLVYCAYKRTDEHQNSTDNMTLILILFLDSKNTESPIEEYLRDYYAKYESYHTLLTSREDLDIQYCLEKAAEDEKKELESKEKKSDREKNLDAKEKSLNSDKTRKPIEPWKEAALDLLRG